MQNWHHPFSKGHFTKKRSKSHLHLEGHVDKIRGQINTKMGVKSIHKKGHFTYIKGPKSLNKMTNLIFAFF
jgi:hypothetical protein